MNAPTLFIADLHLNDQQPEIYARFHAFLKNKARHARALYILGDLFEYYLGDDAISGVIQQVCIDLKELVNSHNTLCFVMHGNRDFLLSRKFSELASIQLIDDPTVISLGTKEIIVTHADALCTDDKDYQLVRQQLRDPNWQQYFLSLSIPERIEFAKQARMKSEQHTQNAKSEIMDVNLNTVNDLFIKYQTPYMIHGHTHRPSFHESSINNNAHMRMVVGDWHYHTSYIEYKNNKFQLVTC